ncbi:family 43 glycosylhydrolase [Actinoplanes sp. LDG1-06]|uniref:Family 43 glycosylhydrolase n=1 Tax=Paractinoplanes ovalisporus TaxID=2810368 RepID=A0ABS2A5F5_9ACTN|nr:family 43 glycosylhydrolase [Actinoplanes ovalisporus]MBM2615072.1 family 43 glycosylhydrolase [Actinoplanes ovalisporus]
MTLSMNRRTLLAGAAGTLAATAVPAAAEAAAKSGTAAAKAEAGVARKPRNWPDPEPYGMADARPELWPRDDNSFVLPLELRPRDEALGRVWMRDTYVNCFTVGGRPLYVATGTSRVPGLEAASPWNDGLFVWTSRSMRGPWRLADTTRFRPDAERGKVWSPEFVGENRPGRTVVAPWQEYWTDTQFGKRGQVWAPEVHYFRGKWYIVACMGDHSQKVGSFLLVSDGGVEGPYRLAEGNATKPFGDPLPTGPAVVRPGAYHHIDGSMYTEGSNAWLVLHNNLYARFRDDMEDIVPATALPAFQQMPYSPEPYLEGAYVFKHKGKYFLLHAAWDRTSINADGTTRYAYDTPAAGRVQFQYDAIVAVSDHFEGPYSERWTAGVGAGHNNFFADHTGQLWATFFRNPNFGYWSNPARLADSAVAGVVRLEWTGERLYVER